MIQFAHTNIVTDDWRKLADFYIEVFGCKPMFPERDLQGNWLDKLTSIDHAHLRGIHLALPGYADHLPTLEIFQYEENIPNAVAQPNLKGFGHIAFKVSDVKAIMEKVLANGGSLVGELVKTDVPNVGTLTVVYTRDIDGNIIEIQNWKAFQ